jgi:hypothetical protein
MIQRAVVGTLLILISVSSYAAQPERRPWQLTSEERLARRFDPEHIRDRQAAYEAAHPRSRPARFIPAGVEKADQRNVTVYRIDGRRNPDLFLPHELFDGLLTALVPDARRREQQRTAYGPGIRALGFNEADFWEQLEAIASDYVALKHSSPDSNEAALCRARHDALRAARNSFGSFDALLYSVIAPARQVSVATDTDDAARLIAAEKGCQ